MAPRLSGGRKPLAEAGAWVFLKNNALYANNISLYPNYSTLQMSNSFTKRLNKRNIRLQGTAQFTTQHCHLHNWFYVAKWLYFTEVSMLCFQAYLFKKRIVLIFMYTAALRNDVHGLYD